MPILSCFVAGLLSTTASAYTFAATDTIAATGTHTHTMIFLHGTCGTGDGESGLFDSEMVMYNENLKYVLPTAPFVYNEREQMSCNSWFATKNVATETWILLVFEILTLNWCGAMRTISTATADQADLALAVTAIRDLINTENQVLMTAHGESSSYHRIFLGGMSQGGLLSLSTLIDLENQLGASLGGVFAYIGYLPTFPTINDNTFCFPLRPMEVPTGTAGEIIKNTPLIVENGY